MFVVRTHLLYLCVSRAQGGADPQRQVRGAGVGVERSSRKGQCPDWLPSPHEGTGLGASHYGTFKTTPSGLFSETRGHLTDGTQHDPGGAVDLRW